MSLKLLTCYRTTTKRRIAVAEAFGSEDGKPFSLELIDEDGKPLSLDGLTVSKNGKFVLRNGDLRFTITNSFDDHLVLVDAPKQRLILQPHLVMFEVLSLIVACAGAGLVVSSPGGPVIGVRPGLRWPGQGGPQTFDLIT